MTRFPTLCTVMGLLLPYAGGSNPAAASPRHRQQTKPAITSPAATTSPLGVEQGTLELDTPDFTLKLLKVSQTVAALQPKNGSGFDFTPSDRSAARVRNGYHHLGDVTLRLRRGSSGVWQDYDTATARGPVHALPASGNTLAAADLAPTLPADCPLSITRAWVVEDGRLGLRFILKNNAPEPVQIGALGLPMIFNNIISDRSLKQAHEICSFADPYIGQDAGYLQVTRLNGKGPPLVVVPDGKTPFEAYQLLNEPTRPNQTFEGAFAWMVHSQAYAQQEWRNAVPWNPPTLAVLAPGASRTYGVKFLVAPDIRHIEATLAANQRPVAVGIPGYVLPQDADGKLFLSYKHKVTSLAVEPKDAIAIHADKPTRHNWQAYTLRGRQWGRVRLTITYDDGLKQAVSYDVIKPAAQAVSDLGHFLTTRQWFVDPADPFHRSPSVMSYDRQADKLVTQDSRVWIAGLGDEGGSGSWLAAAMKEFGQPDPEELAKYEQFVDNVLWGGLQYKDGPNKYGVRKSLFYYDPSGLPTFAYDNMRDWRSWTSWNRTVSQDIGRGYNYPHVVAAYWAMYQAARNHPGIIKNHPWEWYLEQAYQTTRFMFSRDPGGNRRVGYVELGLMEGDIFVAVLDDLKREGWTDKAAQVEALMRERAVRWSREEYPFGSEMAWDSTGQEEVYAWCRYFGYEDKAQVSLNSILGYMPTLPHWAYNGNARRYWDFLYGGKLSRIERQIHHYGSGLNAIPVLAEYRQHPDDFYLLRVGYGGLMGTLTNIDQEGFASVAFHSFPSTLQWDAYSGDYGPNFFGHAYNTATYIVNHPEFGWQAFGGNVKLKDDWVRVQPLDSLRRRVYIAPRGLWLTLDAGAFAGVEINTRTSAVRVGLDVATPFTRMARLRIEQPGMGAERGAYRPSKPLASAQGAYNIPLANAVTWIALTETHSDTSAVNSTAALQSWSAMRSVQPSLCAIRLPLPSLQKPQQQTPRRSQSKAKVTPAPVVLQQMQGVSSVSFLPDGKHVVIGGGDGLARIWDAGTGKQTQVIDTQGAGVSSLAVSPDGSRLVTATQNIAKVWDIATGHEVLTLKGHTVSITSVTYAPDGKHIVTGGGEGAIRVWDAQTGKETLLMDNLKHAVFGVAVSPDARCIAAALNDSTAKVWDMATGKLLLTLKGHTGSVFAVAYSKNGKRLVTGSIDQTARVWNAETGQEMLALEGHTGCVTSVAFSDDGNAVVTGSEDKTALVWSSLTRKVKLTTLSGHESTVKAVAFFPEGTHVLTGSEDSTARIWSLTERAGE